VPESAGANEIRVMLLYKVEYPAR